MKKNPEMLDISILLEEPELDKKVLLEILPLAPLSIVSTLPGSYYKSLNSPTKANLCGMFENILGWHIGMTERRVIIKKLKQVFKKLYKITEFEIETSAVGYTSVLGHLFEVELPIIPAIVSRYDDLWKQQLKHDDARHLKGAPNLSYQLIEEKKKLPTDEKGKIKDTTYSNFFKENESDFPMYYTSPTNREFIVLDGSYQIILCMNSHLLRSLQSSLLENNLAYLGTNEGWVDLSIKEI